MMIVSVFGAIVGNSRYLRAFDLVILVQCLKWWYGLPLDAQSIVVRIDGILNSDRYISVVSRPVALLFIRTLRNATFQQDNGTSHVEGIVWAYLDTRNTQLLPYSARSTDLSPTENVWWMIDEQLDYHHTLSNIVDEVWHLV